MHDLWGMRVKRNWKKLQNKTNWYAINSNGIFFVYVCLIDGLLQSNRNSVVKREQTTERWKKIISLFEKIINDDLTNGRLLKKIEFQFFHLSWQIEWRLWFDATKCKWFCSLLWLIFCDSVTKTVEVEIIF